MTRKEFNALEPGDIIQSASGVGYVVTANYGRRATAAKMADMTNPGEWKLIRKARKGAWRGKPTP